MIEKFKAAKKDADIIGISKTIMRVPLKTRFRILTKRFFSIQGGKSLSAAGLHEHFDNADVAKKIKSEVQMEFLEVPYE